MFSYEVLQTKFVEAYCAWNLYCNIENDIAGLIRKALPKQTADKIQTIGVDEDPDGFLQLTLCLKNEEVLHEVWLCLQKVFPNFEFEGLYNKEEKWSRLFLRLDYDTVENIPWYMS